MPKNTLIVHVENAIKLLEEKTENPQYYAPILKNLKDALYVYENALTNLDTILEDSITKLKLPPPPPPEATDAPHTWWRKVTGQ